VLAHAAATAHLLGGLWLTWCGGSAVLSPYHQGIEQFFWSGAAPAAVRAQGQWWLALFGATLQLMALLMLALVQQGARRRETWPWVWLMAGLVFWAPQDMIISRRAQVWPNLWVDGLVLFLMLPPLFLLYRIDRSAVQGAM
jgi:hypothetical protein